MKFVLRLALHLLALFCPLFLAQAAALAQDSPPAEARLELRALPAQNDGAQAQYLAVLWLSPQPGWHTYGNNPGETGQPTQASLRLSPGNIELAPLFPPGKLAPDAFEPGINVRIYEDETPIFFVLPAKVPDNFKLEAKLRLLLCSAKSCRPSELTAELSFDAAKAGLLPAEQAAWWPLYVSLSESEAKSGLSLAAVEPPPSSPAEPENGPELNLTPRFYSASLEVTGIWQAAALAFLAGLILNFMPCVLPVVSLKFSGLLAVCAHCTLAERQHLLRQHNFFFALGVVLYFLGLGALLSLAGLAWGQIFQQPALVMALSMLLFALGLSLFGVFHLPIIHTGPVAPDKSPALQAFLTGITATLLATPCSGPFLGGVLAWTLLQPVEIILAVFFCLGLGMASPYLLFALRPEAIRFFPRPGAWMQRLEKILGFFLLATVVYFVGILPERLLASALALLWATGLAAWIWGGWTNLSQSRARRLSIRGLAVAVLAAAWLLIWDSSAPSAPKFEKFSPKTLAAELGKNNILLDFTASWCPTCKVLERTVLTGANLRKWTQEYGLRLVQADISQENPQAIALLRQLGSQSIPLVAIFPKGEGRLSPMVLRDLFSAGQLEDALKSVSK